MTPKEQKIIYEWSRAVEGELSLSIILNKGEQSNQLETFCDDLVKHVPQLKVKKEVDKDQPFPEIRIRNNVRFRAVPLENELKPFLHALFSPVHFATRLSQSAQDILSRIEIPVFIKIYVTTQCPFCPKVVLQCLSIAETNTLVNLNIIDGILFPDMAKKDNIRSVPTLILDDQLRWTGSMDIGEIVSIAVNRDPATLSADSLIQIIQDGRAADLAEMMVKNKTIFPAFVELLIHQKWSVRLGAMVSFEHLAEKSTELSSQVIITLWDRFPNLDDQIRGDVLYLMGQSRNPEAISRLKSVLNGDYSSELKEVAQEATDILLPLS